MDGVTVINSNPFEKKENELYCTIEVVMLDKSWKFIFELIHLQNYDELSHSILEI